MASQEELLEIISARMTDQIEKNATSDTVLKLAEAWAWIHSPDQSHGGRSES